jgi:putative MATE family efflux protein
MLVASVDTVMLSSYAQEAVAGIGLVSQYIFFIQLMFNVICIGTSIVLAQYLGAKRMVESVQVTQASTVMVMIIGVAVTLAVMLGARPLLSIYSIDESVREYAIQYLVIYGGAGAFFMALNTLQGAILRSWGYTRDAMYITFAANLVNVLGNALSLYGWFGLPVTGVVGVAASSAISQVVACALFAWRIKARKDIRFTLRGIQAVPLAIYRKILSIGVPTAGENLSYNIAQIAIMSMVSTLGTWAMSAQVYTQTIVRFVFVVSMAIGAATQIKTGYLVGNGTGEEAYRKVIRYQIFGTLVTIAAVLLLNVVKRPIIGLFTSNQEIANITYAILFISIYVETGRSINLITIPALKGAGDVRFPVFVGIASMWGIGVFGAWLLALHFGLGMLGIWIAIGSDESLRGIIMLFRWKNKRWLTKAIT